MFYINIWNGTLIVADNSIHNTYVTQNMSFLQSFKVDLKYVMILASVPKVNSGKNV